MPSTMPLNQSSDQPAVLVSSRPSSSSFCQKSVKVLTPLSSVRLTVTSEPSEEVWNGLAPASQVMESKKPASPVSEVM